MAGLDGRATNMGYANAINTDTYGTALDLTTQEGGDTKLCAKVTDNLTASEEVADTVGCGDTSGLPTDVTLVKKEYRYGLSGDLGFQNGFDRLLAQFFGAAAAPVAAGDGYKHVFTFNPIVNAFFGTFAFESSSTTVIELPSTYVTKLGISMDEVESYLQWSAEIISNQLTLTSPVNSNADLQGLAFEDKELVRAQCGSQFWLATTNDDGVDGALTSGNAFNITSLNLELETPVEVIKEITGGACNSPTPSGDRLGTLTVEVKENSDNSFYQAWEAGTYYSCHAKIDGSAMGAADKSIEILLPKLALVDSPGYDIQNPGRNPYSLVFKILGANNVRTGFASTSPQVNFTNGRSARYYTP